MQKHNLRPTFVAHADWSIQPQKCWLATATLQLNGRYLAEPPKPVGQPETLIDRLASRASASGPAIIGFDFPIGLPAIYAHQIGITSFLELLPKLGQGQWSRFYDVAETAADISHYRPFYPQRPGQSKQQHLLAGLEVDSMNDLRRQCDLPRLGRRAAAPLFWTMGAQQVGKAALHGWQKVLVPALQSTEFEVAIWPFAGPFFDLFKPRRLIMAETYPAECYDHLGVTFSRQQNQPSGKRHQTSRAENAAALLAWANAAQVQLSPALTSQINNGFGRHANGEDPFDATVGLFGILNVILGRRSPGNPPTPAITNLEGWILGQQP